jgi:hypothetical protein
MWPQTLRLTEQLLAVHDGIREVLILEEKGGLFVVAEQATRDKGGFLSSRINETNGRLSPALILGAAAQMTKLPDSLRLVGILYDNVGVMLAYFDEDKLLAISTEPSIFFNAMQTVNDALPGFIKELQIGRSTFGAVRSVVDAGEIARTYVARTTRSSRVFINEVVYRGADHTWQVQGSYRSSRMTPSKGFQLEVDGDAGAIVGFGSSSRSIMLLALELAALFGALGLLAWWLFSNLLAR